MNETGSRVRMSANLEAPPVSPGAFAQEGASGVRLLPNLPPGRCTRKALPFADEIRRLHAMGYTLEAIRQALAAAGVSVSRSTVHREVARASASPPVIPSTDPAQRDRSAAPPRAVAEATPQAKVREASAPPAPPSAPRDSAPSIFANGPSGKDVAEVYMSTQITNPVVRAKEQR